MKFAVISINRKHQRHTVLLPTHTKPPDLFGDYGMSILSKRLQRTTAALAATLLASSLSLSTYATSWHIDQSLSNVNFVTVKKTHVAEAHRFETISGSISDSGDAKVIIETASVNTGIGIRDDRMRQFVFDTVNFPKIIISTHTGELAALQPGESAMQSLSATLSLHGVEKPITLDVLVSRLNTDKLTVTSTKPVIVNAKDFQLNTGVLKLSELMGNISIGSSVPVNFALTFKQ